MKSKSISVTILLVCLCLVGLVSAQTTSPSTVMPNQLTTFTFSDSFLNLVSAANYTWNFGDNTSNVVTSVPTTSHTYIINGTYTLSVNVTAIPNVGSDWNVSSDWQQHLGVYSTSILVLAPTPLPTPTPTPTTDDGVLGIAVVALLMAVTLPVAFFVMAKQKRENQ
jgi:PKD repeat protein